MTSIPDFSDKTIRASCRGVTTTALQSALKRAENDQKEFPYSESRQRRILICREVLTERLLGIDNDIR